MIKQILILALPLLFLTNLALAKQEASPTTDLTSARFNEEMTAKQQQLMSNPQAMSELQQLLQDPEILQALSDPALIKEVTSHDYSAMKDNPKVHELMNNPKMRELVEKINAQEAK